MENAEKVLQEKFHRITQNYTLCYTEKTDIKDAVEIKVEDFDSLSDADKEWLSECNISIMQTLEEEHKDSIEQSKLQFLKELDENLAQEKAKAGHGN